MLFDFEFDFDWDPAKSDRCLRERGFDFEFAAGVFDDDEAFPGPSRWAEDELRFNIIGRTVTGDRLLVVFCWRFESDEEILICRIISARNIRAKEYGRYQEIR